MFFLNTCRIHQMERFDFSRNYRRVIIILFFSYLRTCEFLVESPDIFEEKTTG